MAFCSNCGNQLPENVKFCTSCGTRVSQGSGSEGNSRGFTPLKDASTISRSPGGGGGSTVCYYHTSEPAVAQCARCGKYICKDCTEVYGVTAGEYAGRFLCYDCCQELVAQNVEELTRNKNKIRTQFIISIIGMVIGFSLGMYAGISEGSVGVGLIGGLIYGCICGVFLSALKLYLKAMWEAIVMCFFGEIGFIAGIIHLLIQSFVIAIKCIVGTIANTISYINYLKRTSNCIEEDSAALQQMRDYMDYTLIMSQNKGNDPDSLTNEGGDLYNNSYAQAVRNNGEDAADAALREATTKIARNGEIIRDFGGDS